MSFTQNPGRRAGLLYVLLPIPAVFALIYVPGKLMVRGNPAATLGNIAASETLFRLGIAADLVSQALFILVAMALYDLLKGVNQRRAALMVILIAVSVPITFLNELNAVATLLLLHGEASLAAFTRLQLDALATLFLNLHRQGFAIAAIFWGLWLFPMGLLVYRSGFLPRILGVLLILNCFTYLASSFAALVEPQYSEVVARWSVPFSFGELLFMLWLLIMGAIPKAYPAQSGPAQSLGEP